MYYSSLFLPSFPLWIPASPSPTVTAPSLHEQNTIEWVTIFFFYLGAFLVTEILKTAVLDLGFNLLWSLWIKNSNMKEKGDVWSIFSGDFTGL